MPNSATKQSFLITGGAGFIGSHLSELLLSQDHQVTVIDDLSTGRMENIEPFMQHPNFSFARSTILDETVLDRLASQTEAVIHLAAAVGVKLIVERPVHTIETNIMGTEAVLKAALRYGCKVLIASTSEVYGKGNRIPFAEDDDVLLGPSSKNRWAYAASKMVDEFLGLAYRQEYGLEVVCFRLFNTVGPRQVGHYGMVIPRFVQQALAQEPITIYGDGTQRRCFCDVRDAIEAIQGLAAHKEAVGQVFNIGGREEVSIIDLAKEVKVLSESASDFVHIPYEKAYAPGFEDMERRVPDLSRITNLLGWRPKRNLQHILTDIIRYERQK